MQEVTVEQRLQPEVIEFKVAFGFEGCTQAGQVELLELFVKQLIFNTLCNELRKVIRIANAHFFLADLLAQDFTADGVHQQAGGGVGVVGVFFNQRPGRQNRRLVNLVDRHAVVEVAHRLLNDGIRFDGCTQIGARRLNQSLQITDVKSDLLAAVHHMQQRRFGDGNLRLARAFLGALFTVQHVGACNFVMTAAHQAQLDLVLHIFNVEGPAARARTHQRAHHRLRQVIDRFANAGRCCTLSAMNRQESLHHGHRYLVGCEWHDSAVAANDLVVGKGTDLAAGVASKVCDVRYGVESGSTGWQVLCCLHKVLFLLGQFVLSGC